MVKKIIEPLNADFDALSIKIVASSIVEGPKELSEQSDFLFYGDDGQDKIRVFIAQEDVWVTQAAMADVFGTTKQNISKHLKNIFDEGELLASQVVNKMLTTAADGKSYKVLHYNLDAIVSVGFRVNSRKAQLFRIWAREVLREYLIKGFAMDDERLKQGKTLFGQDYFDELIERIREIRASERRFYQKVTEIYIQCSYDYDPKSDVTKEFFAHAQNKLEYAVTNMTAAEIIKIRADHSLPNMGLTSWKNQKKGGKVRKDDTGTAKNYLTETEIKDLNLLVSSFLDFAERLARKGKRMSMKDWHGKMDDFLRLNEYEILVDYGNVRSKVAKEYAALEFKKFKPIQEAEYKSDFDKVVEEVKAKGISG